MKISINLKIAERAHSDGTITDFVLYEHYSTMDLEQHIFRNRYNKLKLLIDDCFEKIKEEDQD